MVVDSKGQESKAKKYMWLHKSGEPKNPIILYDYQKTRSGSCPREFLKDFSGLKYMPWSKELPEDVRLQNKNIHGKKD